MTMKKAFSSSRSQRCRLCLLLLRAWTVRDSAPCSFVESLLIPTTTTRSVTSIGRLGRQAPHHNDPGNRRGRRRGRDRGVVVFSISHDNTNAASKNDDVLLHSPPTRRSSVSQRRRRRRRFGRLQAYYSRTTITTDHHASSNKPPPFPSKLYPISSALMATVAFLLLVYFPQMSSSSIDTKNFFVTRWQRSQFDLGTQFGAASGFGMAAYLFGWLGRSKKNQHSSKESGVITKILPARLSSLLHLAVIVFCGVGMWAIPGEAGLLRRRNIIVDSMPLPRSRVIASFLVSLLSTIARGVGLWTAIWGWKDDFLKEANNTTTCTIISDGDDEEEPGEEADESSDDSSLDKRLLDFPADLLVIPSLRIFRVSKRHRKRGALFYRNVLLLVLCGAGSNLMDIVFQLRYQNNAASFSFSAMDISLKISAIARQWMIATLLYALKVGSEILTPPTTTKPKTMMDRRDEFDEMKRLRKLKSRANSNNNNNNKPGESKTTEDEEFIKTIKDDDGTSSQLFLERTQHSKRSLTKSMTRINLLVATWPLLIFCGQNLTSVLLPGSWSRPTGTPYLVVSGLFALKAYRFHLLYGENKDEGASPRQEEL